VVVDESNVTRGDNVGATLTAVTEGAVAAIVYVTDARAAGAAVDAVEIPAEENVLAAYPIGVLADAGAPAASDAFVAFVLGDDGQAVLRAFGFLPPT
jgi:molybdate transport system substrate-binding protein